MNRFYRRSNKVPLVLVLLLAVGSYGCPVNFGGGCDVGDRLNSIHESYEREFTAQVTGNAELTMPEGSFAETHGLIDDFISGCKNATGKETAHVMVLQSLMYLQTGEFDKAELAVNLAQSFIDEAEPRDKALISSLPDVINGWEAYAKIAPPNDPIEANIKNAVDTLDIVLTRLDAEDFDSNDEEIDLYLTALRSYLHHARAKAIGEYGEREYEQDYQKEAGEGRGQRINDYDAAISTLGEALRGHISGEEFRLIEEATVPANEVVFNGEPRYARYKKLYIDLKRERSLIAPGDNL